MGWVPESNAASLTWNVRRYGAADGAAREGKTVKRESAAPTFPSPDQTDRCVAAGTGQRVVHGQHPGASHARCGVIHLARHHEWYENGPQQKPDTQLQGSPDELFHHPS